MVIISMHDAGAFCGIFNKIPPPTMLVIEILNDRPEQHILAAPANVPQFSLLHDGIV
jgi:hypothetical protein